MPFYSFYVLEWAEMRSIFLYMLYKVVGSNFRVCRRNKMIATEQYFLALCHKKVLTSES